MVHLGRTIAKRRGSIRKTDQDDRLVASIQINKLQVRVVLYTQTTLQEITCLKVPTSFCSNIIQQYTYQLLPDALLCLSRDEVIHLSFHQNSVKSNLSLVAENLAPHINPIQKPGMFEKYISIKDSIEKWEA